MTGFSMPCPARFVIGSWLVVALIGLLAACGGAEPLPLELTQRESLLSAGTVIQITNTSGDPLRMLQVELRGPGGEQRSYTVPTLEGFGSVEIGWRKLGGWQIVAGTRVEVTCEGLPGRFSGSVE